MREGFSSKGGQMRVESGRVRILRATTLAIALVSGMLALNVPSLAECNWCKDCECCLCYDGHFSNNGYVVSGTFSLGPSGCEGASVANKQVVVTAKWNNGEEEVKTRTDPDGEFSCYINRQATRYNVTIRGVVKKDDSFSTPFCNCNVAGMYIVCQCQWCLKSKPKPSTAAGGDPPIWGTIMAFPTVERHIRQDLNGDGDLSDTVLRYMDVQTGEVVNTGAIVSGAARAISIYEDVIAFVGERGMIRYYRISTGEFTDVGVAGHSPSLYGDTLVFVTSGRIVCFDLRSATFLDVDMEGSSPTIHGGVVAFAWGGTIRYHDLASGTTVDTGELGHSPFVHGDIIAFVVSEHIRGQDLNGDGDQLDAVISYYRISSGEVVCTGADGSFPWVYGDVIVFDTDEVSVGEDLNGDGKILESVVRYWSTADGEVVNTGILGTEPSIYEETITYYVWETWIGHDLTGDGDVGDSVVGFFRISDGVWAYRGADAD